MQRLVFDAGDQQVQPGPKFTQIIWNPPRITGNSELLQAAINIAALTVRSTARHSVGRVD